MDQINHIHYITPMMFGPATAGGRIFSTDSSWSVSALAFLKAHNTVVDPTVALYEWARRPASQPLAEIEPGEAHLPPALRQLYVNTGASPANAAAAHNMYEQYLAAVSALHRAGITIVAGTDQSIPGYSLHREIEIYSHNGFTPLEALQSATIVPARVMKLDAETGSVTAGKRADLLVVDADPLADVANLRRISLVIANGKRYVPAPLWRSVGFTP